MLICILTHEDILKVRFAEIRRTYLRTFPQDIYISYEYVRFLENDIGILARISEETPYLIYTSEFYRKL
ncbi:hypothetical protein [Gottschalkia purinilytica]|uniref:hypothetical protein n=1 Tax=Gottschalkia purinilytica TaxID=1503 RepID=UPI00067D5716|nr:hypothetical protein [Gottschalkia purinilytica]